MKMFKCRAYGKREYYIIARSPKRAKIIYKSATRSNLRDVSCCVADVDVDSEEIEGIVYPGSDLALSYGVEYGK